MVELGRLEKPLLDDFAGKRKIYAVSSVYLPENPDDEYKTLFHKYWDEVIAQIEKIEAAGKIRKIFCEHIVSAEEDSLDAFARVNERAAQLIRKKMEEGVALLPLETEEIYGPLLDWRNCLQVVGTRKVFEQVFDFYTELLTLRFQNIIDVLEKNLADNEAGLLILGEEDRLRLRFPDDIEVFFVRPPSYDDIVKWTRGEMRARKDKEEDG
ncbi:MAG: hypothetical protein OEW04_07020 [Nitrospirota bacterium]|nr:hypothetical protein [Nitrospirota bacterium]